MSEGNNLPAISEAPLEPVPYAEDENAAYLWARQAWWRGWASNQEIADAIEVPRWKVQQWVSGRNKDGWKHLKERASEENLKKLIKSDQDEISDVIKDMIRIAKDSIEHIIDSNKKLNISDISSLTVAAERFFKMRQLLLGSPTEILGGDKGEDVTWTKIYERMKEVDIIEVGKGTETVTNSKQAKVVVSDFAVSDHGKLNE